MAITLQLWTTPGGKRTTINPLLGCLGCGADPEVRSYFTRTYTRDGVPEVIRVGYHCSCGAVVVDGMMEGATLTFETGPRS